MSERVVGFLKARSGPTSGQIFSVISEQNKEQREERDKLVNSLKSEIEKDFASKMDMLNISNRLDQLWIRISAVVVTAIGFGSVIGWVVTTSINATKLLTQ